MRLVVSSVVLACVAATATAAQVTMRGQGAIRGLAHDSLLHAPLIGADVWVRGTTLRTLTDSTGGFRFDTLPEGRHVLVLSHPGLDSVGFFNLAAAVTVETGRVATTLLATPSLATIWQRRCPAPLAADADSGVLMGVVTDAATGNRLAGAGVVGAWVVIQQNGVNVSSEDRSIVTRTDSIGGYYACGVSTDATIHMRAYGTSDSTGVIQVRPSGRAVARRDFAVGHTARGATIRGTVTGEDGKPIAGARVAVDSTTAVTKGDGVFLLPKLPAGTQWLTVRAISRAPFDQAVDLRDGDTLHLDLPLGATAVTLDTVRIVGTRLWSTLQGIEDRKKSGFGTIRSEAELRGRPDIVATLQGMPSLRVERRRGALALVFPGRSMSGLGGCLASVYLDGMRVSAEQLLAYKPDELRAIEVYPRGSGAPLQFATTNGCGVVLVWTKYLQ